MGRRGISAGGVVLKLKGECPISTLTLCISGLIRVEELWNSVEWPPLAESGLVSRLIRAIVGVMGSVLAAVGVEAIKPLAVLRLTVFSALTRCLWLGVEGVAGGRVAAVHVSVTGHNSDLILFNPTLLVEILVV